MAKVIKAGTRKRDNEQKTNACDADSGVTIATCDSDMPSTAVATAVSTSTGNPRNALVVLKKQTDIDHTQVEMAAYFKAEKRNFAPGNEMQDWLEAESEIGPLVR